jgi:hypothetical protein
MSPFDALLSEELMASWENKEGKRTDRQKEGKKDIPQKTQLVKLKIP